MARYSIEIPNNKKATYRVVTFIILLINLLVFGFVFFTAVGLIKYFCLFGFILNSMAMISYFLWSNSHSWFLRSEPFFVVSALIWIFIGNLLPGLLMLVFAIMGFYVNKKLQLLFSEQGILYPSFPSSKIIWSKVEQVILKDGILTIDLKDNRLLQFSLDPLVSGSLDQQAFNAFCNKHISQG